MVRSKKYPWGFPWVADRFRHEIWLGNVLIEFSIKVIETLKETGQGAVKLLAEHPEDLGTIYREEDGATARDEEADQQRGGQPGPLHPGLQPVLLRGTVQEAHSIDDQPGGSEELGPHGWPVFDEDGKYAGPLNSGCTCRPTMSLAKSRQDSTFRTTGASAYPADMDEALAYAILAEAPSLMAKVGDKRKGGNKEVDEETPKKKNKEAAGETPKEAAGETPTKKDLDMGASATEAPMAIVLDGDRLWK